KLPQHSCLRTDHLPVLPPLDELIAVVRLGVECEHAAIPEPHSVPEVVEAVRDRPEGGTAEGIDHGARGVQVAEHARVELHDSTVARADGIRVDGDLGDTAFRPEKYARELVWV